MDRGPRRTTWAVRQFKGWFGGIFLTIGLVALLIGLVLLLVASLVTGPSSTLWAYVIPPLGIGIIFSLLGGTFVGLGLRQARKEERLRQVGTTTEATVITVEPTSTRINHRRLWHVRYTYADLYGISHEGTSGYLAAEDARSYRIGEQALARYDPEHPTISIWLGRDEIPKQP